jgi:hypothetical protein
MSSDEHWLPSLLLLEDFDGAWPAYLAAVLAAFERDFGADRPLFRGKRMAVKRHPLMEGMSATFWHLISEGSGETERVPDLRRCERIAWPMAVLRAADDAQRVRVWEERDPKRGRKVLIALPDFSYLVVLDDRGEYVLPWTAYPVERDHSRRKLAKRFNDARAQKC